MTQTIEQTRQEISYMLSSGMNASSIAWHFNNVSRNPTPQGEKQWTPKLVMENQDPMSTSDANAAMGVKR